VRTKVSAGLA